MGKLLKEIGKVLMQALEESFDESKTESEDEISFLSFFQEITESKKKKQFSVKKKKTSLTKNKNSKVNSHSKKNTKNKIKSKQISPSERKKVEEDNENLPLEGQEQFEKQALAEDLSYKNTEKLSGHPIYGFPKNSLERKNLLRKSIVWSEILKKPKDSF